MWHLHEQPRDFYRYTKFGLQYLAEKSGFEVVSIKPTGGFFLSTAHEIGYMIYFFTELKILRPLQVILMNVFLLLGKLLNFVDPTKNRLPQSYVCVLRKNKFEEKCNQHSGNSVDGSVAGVCGSSSCNT